MSLGAGNLLLASAGDAGYNLTRSLRFRASATAWLNRTFSAGNQKTWTWSGWVKRGTLTSAQAIFDTGVLSTSDSTFARFGFDPSDAFNFTAYATSWRTTSQVFRDPSAWYHIILAFDTTQATAANRVKVYVNGAQVTAFSNSADPTLNTNYAINQAAAHYFGYPAYSYGYFDGYLAEVNFIDGQALTPSSFGSYNALTGVWQPARYTGTYGTNGFYLPFTDNSALTTSSNVGLGKDFSGNGNYWTTNNISITAGVTYDSMTDVPTLTSATAANYCVLNAVNQPSSTTLNDGNLKIVATTASYRLTQSTFTLTSGKYYFEMTKLTTAQYVNGLALVLSTLDKNTSTINQAGVYLVTNSNPSQITSYTNGGGSVLIGTVDWANNDIIQCAYDATTGKIWFGRNGTWYPATNGGTIGDPAAGTNQTVTGVSGLTPTVISYDTSSSCAINFGQRPFTYSPPSGFLSLNTFNLPDSTIVKGNTVMDATLYTGTGAAQTITNAAAFKPDLVWIKSRSAAFNNGLNDSARGAGKFLYSNLTDAEGNFPTDFSSFNSNGFSLGTGTGNVTNSNGGSYVAWQWQAGQGSTSSNTNGTITSTVSVNASAGFSIVTYTGNGTNGATVGHGLGVKPSLIIEKGRASAYNWVVQGCGVLWPTATQTLFLNSTSGLNAGSAIAAPTSSVFTPAALSYANESGLGYVNYCWTPIAGFSAFGSYTGNGSTDGPMVYTGFQPKFVIIKRTDTTGNWTTFDSVRDPYNAAGKLLYPNYSNAEETDAAQKIDFLSNGFKIRGSNANQNAPGGTYIYAAFASNPFKNSLAF